MSKNYVVATNTKADRWFISTRNYTTHPAVSLLRREMMQSPLVSFRSGYFSSVTQPKNIFSLD